MPEFGAYSVSVPGTVHGWETLLASHGSMTLSQVLKPAIQYAEEGFPVTEVIAYQWHRVVDKIARLPSRTGNANRRSCPKTWGVDDHSYSGQYAADHI